MSDFQTITVKDTDLSRVQDNCRKKFGEQDVSLGFPSGAMTAYGGASAPSGWIKCDGSAVSRTTYSALFAAIGGTYGAGDGTTTFNVPNLQGVFPRGAGSQTISGSTYSATLGASQNDDLKSHGHTYQVCVGGAGGNTATGGPAGWDSFIGNSGIQRINATGGTETRPANVGVTWIIKT